MSLLQIQCSGRASSLFTRQKTDKKLARRIFSPIQQIHFDQHEIANHYKDFKRKRIHRERRRRKSSPAKYLGSPKNRLSLTSTREILQMPCFVFPRLDEEMKGAELQSSSAGTWTYVLCASGPSHSIACLLKTRFGKNFPWRGRQTLCGQHTTKIENATLQQISSAVTVSDFNKLFIQQTYNLSPSTGSGCISHEKNSYNNPLTCHIEKGEILSNRKPATSTAHTTHINQHRNRKGKARYNITTKVGGNESFDDETEHLEWYIELASRCYTDGFQWHMNYLNDCTRRGALLKRRRLTGAVSKSISHCASHSAEQQQQQQQQQQAHLAGSSEIDQKIANDDRFREDVSDCKIRININQSLNSNLNTKTINQNTYNNTNSSSINTRKRSTNYSYVAHLNKKINIMNSSGYSIIDAINSPQNDMKTDRLNEVLDNFGSLNISCGGSVLPQIVLTDFSSIDSMPRTNTLLLTPSSATTSAEQFNISGTKTQSQAECLSIPAEYYRNETRPC